MPSSELVQSVTRALLILEHLAGVEDGMTLQQLCQELDLKSPTVHNLLRTLAARGYVERLSEPARYRLGPTLIDLTDQYRHQTTQRMAARAVSQVFARFSFARVTYAEAERGDIVLKLRMTPERPGLLERPWHSVMLAYVSASVLVFQAYWPEDQRELYDSKYPFEIYGVHIWGDADRAACFLDEVRRKGYAAPPPDANGLYRLAVPIFNAEHALLGVLGAAFNADDVTDPDQAAITLAAHLKETARTFIRNE